MINLSASDGHATVNNLMLLNDPSKQCYGCTPPQQCYGCTPNFNSYLLTFIPIEDEI